MGYAYFGVDGMWSVVFYKPNDTFDTESEHPTQAAAAARVHYLNGGCQDCGTSKRMTDTPWMPARSRFV